MICSMPFGGKLSLKVLTLSYKISNLKCSLFKMFLTYSLRNHFQHRSMERLKSSSLQDQSYTNLYLFLLFSKYGQP
jgi:hypothetical protein